MTPPAISLDFLDRLSVLVVGDVMLDRYIWGDIRRISPEAPVPVVEVDRETHTAGGAANVAHNLAALGVKCELFGLVGTDASGAELQAMLAAQGVAFDGRLARPEVPTITKTRVVAQRQQVCRLDREGPPAGYAASTAGLLGLLAEKAAAHDAVILSDYAKGVIDQALVDALREVRRQRGTFLGLDPKPTRPLEIAGMDLLTPNRGEAVQLAGLPPAGRHWPSYDELVGKIMARHRPRRLVLTLSEQGMLLREEGGLSCLVPTVAHQVADVSGAGDTVMAVLTAAMAGGLAAVDAVRLANAAAGVVVGKLGTATLTRAELLAALAHDTPPAPRRA